MNFSLFLKPTTYPLYAIKIEAAQEADDDRKCGTPRNFRFSKKGNRASFQTTLTNLQEIRKQLDILPNTTDVVYGVLAPHWYIRCNEYYEKAIQGAKTLRWSAIMREIEWSYLMRWTGRNWSSIRTAEHSFPRQSIERHETRQTHFKSKVVKKAY